MRRVLHLAPAVWLVALLLAPGALWVAGMRQPPLPNEPAAAAPLLVEPGRYADQAQYDALDRFVRDRLPLRREALKLRAAIAIDGFGASTDAFVDVGDDGWMFTSDEIRSCERSSVPIEDAMEILSATLVASGRRPVLTVTGTKVLQERRLAPAVDPAQARCQASLERRVSARLRQIPGGVDLAPGMAALARRGEHAFLKHDTHWASPGRLLYVRSMLDAIRPGLAADAGLGLGPAVDRPGDLARVFDVDRTDRDAPVFAARAVKNPPQDVLVVGDSQSHFSLVDPPFGTQPAIFSRPLKGATWCHMNQLESGSCDPMLRDARTIVIQASARAGLDGVAALEVTQLCSRLVTVLGERLTGPSARWVLPGAPDGSRDGTLRLDGRMLHARLDPTGPDRAPYARLFAAPVAALPPSGSVFIDAATDRGKPLACARRALGASGQVLMIPVLAGRSVAEAQVRLLGSRGARVGPPIEIALRPPVG